MLVVASIVSAYALVACSATSWMWNAIKAGKRFSGVEFPPFSACSRLSR
jgi:hypothetical protein